MDWDKLRIFYTVSQSQSFTKAGETLNLSQSAVSRQIGALEDKLQVSLFHRHARGLLLTEQGEILYRTVAEIFNKLAATENALLESKERPRGPFRITAPAAIGTTWLTPQIREFIDLYPEISVTLIVDDRELDLSMREADAAIRLYPAKQPDLIQRQMITLHNSVYASNDYLRQFGVPRDAAALQNHRLVGYAEESRLPFAEINWLFEALGGHEKLKAVFKINGLLGMLKAVESGVGIASLPDYMAQGNTQLTKLNIGIEGPTTDVYFIYSSELRNSKRVKVFREFLIRKFAETKF